MELFSSIDNIKNITKEDLSVYSIEEYSADRKTFVINNDIDSNKAVEKIISNHRLVGFDTEKKPTFTKNTKSNGTSLIQISTKNECYIFQIKQIKNIRPILNILSNNTIFKVGSGLKSDKSSLAKEFKISLRQAIDISSLFKSKLGHRNEVGIKNAVSAILKKNILKSKKMSTSNWEKNNLTENQIKYASEDAFAAFDVFCTLLKNYPFTLSVMPPTFQQMFDQNLFCNDN